MESGARSPTDSDGSSVSSDATEAPETLTNGSGMDAEALFNLDDLPPPGSSPYTGTSFPGIHFRESSESRSRSSHGFDDSSDEDEEEDVPILDAPMSTRASLPKINPRILYIQMVCLASPPSNEPSEVDFSQEFVENQTLKEVCRGKHAYKWIVYSFLIIARGTQSTGGWDH